MKTKMEGNIPKTFKEYLRLLREDEERQEQPPSSELRRYFFNFLFKIWSIFKMKLIEKSILFFFMTYVYKTPMFSLLGFSKFPCFMVEKDRNQLFLLCFYDFVFFLIFFRTKSIFLWYRQFSDRLTSLLMRKCVKLSRILLGGQ